MPKSKILEQLLAVLHSAVTLEYINIVWCSYLAETVYNANYAVDNA